MESGMTRMVHRHQVGRVVVVVVLIQVVDVQLIWLDK
jgi:hypothetical protein